MNRSVALSVFLASVASAEWRQLGTVSGTPADVIVVDGGLVVTATSGAGGRAIVWHALDDGGVAQPATLNGATGYVGAGFDGTCLSALTPTSSLELSAGCGGPVTVAINSAGAYRSLGARGIAVTFNGSLAQFASANPLDGTWTAQVPNFTQAASARGVGFANIGGADFAMSASSGVPGLRVSVDGGAPFPVTGAPACVDVSPFELAGAPAAIAVTSVGGLVLIPDVRGGTNSTATFPVGQTPRRAAMAGAAGLVSTATGAALSPIPDPSNPGLNWVQRAAAPPLDGRVHCLDANTCAALLSDGQVWLYENRHAPTVAIGAVVVTPGVPAHFVADAGDADNDPLFISWSAPGAVISSDGGFPDGREVDITFPAGVCMGTVEVTARDATSATTAQVMVNSDSRGALVVDGPSTAVAGGPPVDFSAAVDGGCVGATISWSTSDGGVGSGPNFTWTPPETSCVPGGDVLVTATATWASGAPATTQQSRVVTIEPWGAPQTPVFPSPAQQDGGTVVLWAPTDSAHECAAAAGFPGTELVWESLDAGGASVQLLDGGALIDAASLCAPTQVVASAYRVVVGEQRGRRSDAGTLIVDVLPARAPLDATTPFVMSAMAASGLARGDTSTSASCLAERNVEALLTIREGVTDLASGRFRTPGPWSLAIPGGCAGGTYEVVAQLLEDGNATGAEARETLTTTATPVAVGALDVTEVIAACGQAAAASVTLQAVDGACAASTVTWRSVGGPPLVVPSGTGEVVPLRLQASGFDAVGQTVALEFTASGGGSNVATETREVRVTAEPFVSVRINRARPLTQQEEVRTVNVSVGNSTACDVSGLAVTVMGHRLVAESLRIDGQVVPVEVIEGGLRVPSLSLTANAESSLTVQQGPALTGTDVTVTLNGVVVGETNHAVGTPECGCGVGGGGLSVLSLLALTLLRRRRARVD